MNKNDRHVLCTLVAEWEWNERSGASEAGAVASCARQLRREMKLTAEELAFYRAYEIYKRIQQETGMAEDELFLDVLIEQVEFDLDGVIDQIEIMAWKEFADHIASMKDT